MRDIILIALISAMITVAAVFCGPDPKHCCECDVCECVTCECK